MMNFMLWTARAVSVSLACYVTFLLARTGLLLIADGAVILAAIFCVLAVTTGLTGLLCWGLTARQTQ